VFDTAFHQTLPEDARAPGNANPVVAYDVRHTYQFHIFLTKDRIGNTTVADYLSENDPKPCLDDELQPRSDSSRGGSVIRWGSTYAQAWKAIAMSMRTIIVGANAQLPRRLKVPRGHSVRRATPRLWLLVVLLGLFPFSLASAQEPAPIPKFTNGEMVRCHSLSLLY